VRLRVLIWISALLWEFRRWNNILEDSWLLQVIYRLLPDVDPGVSKIVDLELTLILLDLMVQHSLADKGFDPRLVDMLAFILQEIFGSLLLAELLREFHDAFTVEIYHVGIQFWKWLRGVVLGSLQSLGLLNVRKVELVADLDVISSILSIFCIRWAQIPSKVGLYSLIRVVLMQSHLARVVWVLEISIGKILLILILVAGRVHFWALLLEHHGSQLRMAQIERVWSQQIGFFLIRDFDLVL
jgi:hypothetical protein